MGLSCRHTNAHQHHKHAKFFVLAQTRPSHCAQELMSEGLPDGVRMNHKQYKAMLVRDRTIKRVG